MGHGTSPDDVFLDDDDTNNYNLQQRILLLNPKQLTIFNEVMSSVRQGSGRLFSIDAPGGTGKTMLLKTVIDQARQEGFIAIATALTGVAAILLPGGRTLHSKLKVPIDLTVLKRDQNYLNLALALIHLFLGILLLFLLHYQVTLKSKNKT